MRPRSPPIGHFLAHSAVTIGVVLVPSSRHPGRLQLHQALDREAGAPHARRSIARRELELDTPSSQASSKRCMPNCGRCRRSVGLAHVWAAEQRERRAVGGRRVARPVGAAAPPRGSSVYGSAQIAGAVLRVHQIERLRPAAARPPRLASTSGNSMPVSACMPARGVQLRRRRVDADQTCTHPREPCRAVRRAAAELYDIEPGDVARGRRLTLRARRRRPS